LNRLTFSESLFFGPFSPLPRTWRPLFGSTTGCGRNPASCALIWPPSQKPSFWSARHPLVITGRGARNAGDALLRFLNAIGALYLDTHESRGLVPADWRADLPWQNQSKSAIENVSIFSVMIHDVMTSVSNGGSWFAVVTTR